MAIKDEGPGVRMLESQPHCFLVLWPWQASIGHKPLLPVYKMGVVLLVTSKVKNNANEVLDLVHD